jgi:hypothetical protein
MCPSRVNFNSESNLFPVTHVVGYVLVYMSACVNPIIYVFMNKQYRMAFKAVLCPSSLQSVTRVTFHSSTENPSKLS